MLIFEDIRTIPRRRLFRLLGVEWLATPYAWLSPVLYAALGIVIALAGGGGQALGTRLVIGLGYGAIVWLGDPIHTLGHIASGTLAGSPLDAVLLTATFHADLYYGDQRRYPRRAHVGRALGGPLASLLVGALAGAGWALTGSHALAILAVTNVGVGLYVLLPLRGLDGWVLWGKGQ